MLMISGYTIDRLVSVSDLETCTEFRLQSGVTCCLPKSHPGHDPLARLAQSSLATSMPLAMKITEGVLAGVALDTCRPVKRLDPRLPDATSITVWLVGQPGPYDFSFTSPDAEIQYQALLKSAETKCKLFFLLDGRTIISVTDLLPEQHQHLKDLGAIQMWFSPGSGVT